MAARRVPAALKPQGLGARGAALWKALAPDDPADVNRILLVTEACRLADRLDRLNELISGDADAWARVRLPKNESELVLRIDSAVTEARQTANVLRQIVGQLGPTGVAGGPSSSPVQVGRAIVDSIVARHADGSADTGSA